MLLILIAIVFSPKTEKIKINYSKAPGLYKEYLIQKYSEKYDVEIALIKAIKMRESRCGKLFRPEPKLKKKKKYEWYRRWLTDKEKQNYYAWGSLGDMHILFAVAKSIGYKGMPEKLKLPENSYRYGIKYLKYLINRYYYLSKVISAYNGGYPFKEEDGSYHNQRYVDDVVKYYIEYNGIHKEVMRRYLKKVNERGKK